MSARFPTQGSTSGYVFSRMAMQAHEPVEAAAGFCQRPDPSFRAPLFWLDLTSGIAGASLGMARDCWVENLRCPHCGKTGEARLSAADAYSWDVRVDRAPEGFKLMRSNFYCAACDIPAEL